MKFRKEDMKERSYNENTNLEESIFNVKLVTIAQR
jgi:hypothetical protein